MAKLNRVLARIPMYSNKRNNLLTVLTTVLLKWEENNKKKTECKEKKKKKQVTYIQSTHGTFIDAIIHR